MLVPTPSQRTAFPFCSCKRQAPRGKPVASEGSVMTTLQDEGTFQGHRDCGRARHEGDIRSKRRLMSRPSWTCSKHIRYCRAHSQAHAHASGSQRCVGGSLNEHIAEVQAEGGTDELELQQQ